MPIADLAERGEAADPPTSSNDMIYRERTSCLVTFQTSPSNRLVLHGVEFGDPAEAHHLRLAVRLVGQELIQFIERLRAGYQESPRRAGWKGRTARTGLFRNRAAGIDDARR